jgi:hypothetical protein
MAHFGKIKSHLRKSSVGILPTAEQPSHFDDPEALEARLKHDAQNAATLLRQLYELDIEIWGQRHVVHDDDRRAIEELKHRANARLAEVRMIVEGWSSMPKAKWTPKDRERMDSIRKAIQESGEKRYLDKKKR